MHYRNADHADDDVKGTEISVPATIILCKVHVHRLWLPWYECTFIHTTQDNMKWARCTHTIS